MTPVIRGAGGLVIKKTSKDKLRILLVHRPSYDDWGLPKGKIDQDETQEEAAVREVFEETGYRCRIVTSLGTTRHRLEHGVKEVVWYAMRPLPDSPGFTPSPEIDEIRWISPKQAAGTLDYENERELVTGTDLRAVTQTGTIRLLRHAMAGDRSNWDGDDRKRPLSGKGRRQAEAIADALSGAGIDRIVSSPYKRCIETVWPLSRATGAEIEISDVLAEGASTNRSLELFESLIGYNAVLCSHGDVIPDLMNRLIRLGLGLESELTSPKGSIWEVETENGKLTTARHVPPPAT